MAGVHGMRRIFLRPFFRGNRRVNSHESRITSQESDHAVPSFGGSAVLLWLDVAAGRQRGGGGKVLSELTDEHRAAWRAVFEQRIPGGPTERGFDEYFGTDVPNWPPYYFLENDRTIGIPSELLPEALLAKNQASLQGPALPELR